MRKELSKNYNRLSIDFRNADWLKILLRAREANMKPTTFIKRMAVDGELIVYNLNAMNSLTLSINRIGNNINQIVHLANKVQTVDADEIEALTKKLEQVRSEIDYHQFHLKNYERKKL
jgi:hypothetical protein